MQQRAVAMVQGARAWVPPPPRDAATVCLMRDSAAGPEVFLMRRPTTMAFAPGMNVFPGGAVEPVDSDLPFVPDADLRDLGRRAATAAPRALLAAAVRETFEECGVLLAVDRAGAVASCWQGSAQDRVELDSGRLSLADLLQLRGLALDPGLLPLVGHWVTPEVEDRRFDTRFFLAAMPEGQQAGETGPESDGSGWWTPAAAIEAYTAGRLALLAPTLATLAWLGTGRDVATLLAAAATATVRPLLPALRPDATGGLRWMLLDARSGVELTPADTSVTSAGITGLEDEGPAGSETVGVG